MNKDEALKLAIEAMENIEIPFDKYTFEAINACKEALDTEQVRESVVPTQPVAYNFLEKLYYPKDLPNYLINTAKPLYTRPAQPCQECENLKHDLDSYMKMAHAYANQQRLSHEAIEELWEANKNTVFKFARAIEKAHGIGE